MPHIAEFDYLLIKFLKSRKFNMTTRETLQSGAIEIIGNI